VAGPARRERLICRVEIPKGSRNKYEWDLEKGALFLSRFLSASVVYPTDYGFFPETLAEDGDPLDALVCVSEPTFPGCLIEVKPIALLGMTDEEGGDDKVLCVPCTDPNWMDLEQLEDIPPQLRIEIEHFFSIYKQPEGKPVEVTGWRPRDDALAVLEESRARYRAEGAE
jgi:inorganic pyrophosphatase